MFLTVYLCFENILIFLSECFVHVLIVFILKINTLRSRFVVITRGEKSIFVAIGSGESQTFPVDTIERNLIKDTNGAGDAFSGGWFRLF